MLKHLLNPIFGERRRPVAMRVPFRPESIFGNGGIGPSLMTEFSSLVRDRLYIQFLDSLIFLKWISAAADGKFVLYDQFDHEESTIMLLENFR
jgi:hypothetical protein